MMLVRLFLASLWVTASLASAQKTLERSPNFSPETETFPLWEHGAPGALGSGDQDTPTITVYPPLEGSRTGTAILIAPGGSYRMLALNHEGRQFANFFNGMNVTAFVLKYRLGPRYHHPIELGDVQRGIRWVRAHSEKYGFKPDRIGLVGFSAGGHLASTAGTHFDDGKLDATDPIDRVSSRPDFLILAYPVITMLPPYAHEGSVANLLGENASLELRKQLSNERNVTAQTPPTFLLSTSEDTVVAPENTVEFYLALRKAGVPAEMHVFEKGPHGVGMDLENPVLGIWPMLLTNWLRQRGLLSK
ncbi:MAG TPA: alpha/beta hydrolase [Terriglobales bacterium]|jgi:acetyl esterase/lipase|nr:alpha/beta hydrolase [Terriglobales bacterium]